MVVDLKQMWLQWEDQWREPLKYAPWIYSWKFLITQAPFAVSLQDAMAIILKRRQDETCSAPSEWVTFIKKGKSKGTIEESIWTPQQKQLWK
jgi:hypothetical protein